MMEQHASKQASALSDLQSELRSLKTLLQSRQLQSSSTNLPNGSNSPTANGISTTTAAANALLTPKGRGIPAWQMASSSAGSAGTSDQEKSPAGSVVDVPSRSSSLYESEVLEESKDT